MKVSETASSHTLTHTNTASSDISPSRDRLKQRVDLANQSFTQTGQMTSSVQTEFIQPRFPLFVSALLISLTIEIVVLLLLCVSTLTAMYVDPLLSSHYRLRVHSVSLALQ